MYVLNVINKSWYVSSGLSLSFSGPCTHFNPKDVQTLLGTQKDTVLLNLFKLKIYLKPLNWEEYIFITKFLTELLFYINVIVYRYADD